MNSYLASFASNPLAKVILQRSFRGRIRPEHLTVLSDMVMVSRITVSLAVMLGLCATTIRLPVSPCVLTNTASEKACEAGCCANKTCCVTSHKRTGSPVQAATKSGSDQQSTLAIASSDGYSLPVHFGTDSHFVSDAERVTHSPPTLALICIRLI